MRVRRVHALAFVVACVLDWPCVLAQDEEKLSITHGPYLQAVTEDSATVVWFTNRNCVSHVEYSPEDSSSEACDVKRAVAIHHGLIDANTMMHRIPLTGLAPGAGYRYSIASTEILEFDPDHVTWGGTVTDSSYHLQTLNPQKDEFSFCVVNDLHGKPDRLNSLLDTISWDRMDMVFLNGDVLDHWSRENQVFDGFLDICVARFAREMPFIYVRGNHDTRGALARRLIDYFPTPNGRHYFAFRHGPVHFLVLDTGEADPDSSDEFSGLAAFDSYRAEQTQWLLEAVQNKDFQDARYRIVVMHIPPCPDEDSHGAWQTYRLWTPILNDAGVDLAICGHRHDFDRVKVMEWANRFPIIINGSDTVACVDVNENRLKVTVNDTDGQLVDKTSLKPRSSN